MRRLIVFLFVIGLIAAAVGCEKTITEPGETEHGGPFLHAAATR
jgi:hypothetical protein